MEFLFVLVIIAAIAFVLLSRRKASTLPPEPQADAEPDGFPYRATDALFSAAERSFYGVLKQACADRAVVFGKVRLGDLVAPRAGLPRGQNQSARNKVNLKHVDFVVCDPDTLKVLCAVELDDASHEREDRQQRDTFVDGALAAAGITAHHFKAKEAYPVQAVRAALFSDVPAEDSSRPPETQTEVPAPTADEQSCPKCGSPLVERVRKSGDAAGESFLGCSTFPKCRYTRALDA